MHTRLGVAGVLAGVLAFSYGCATKEQTGSVVGAGLGATAGGYLTDSPLGSAAGAALGAYIGSEVGAEMDRRDAERAAYALQRVPAGQPYSWHNPQTDAYYELTPQDSYYGPRGAPCRRFEVEARVHGEIDETYGTACMQPDGTWDMAS